LGKKQKALELAANHEFALRTAANPEEALDVLVAAAGAAAPGGLHGSIRCADKRVQADQFLSEWEFRGPGGLVKIMTFTISGEPSDGQMVLRLKIGKFLYQKGSMFTKPTLNGGKQLEKFRQLVTEQLHAQAV
jgi:hypothetical protein